ncbi:MAG: FtsH protease activity modulator HflK [Myxococcota bacterium]
MAGDEETPPLAADERIRRQVGRTIANWAAVLLSLGVIVGWGVTGFYQLAPGEGAVILRVGQFDRTESEPGLRWHWPPPLESHDKVNIQEIRRERFGFGAVEEAVPGEQTATFETAIQTADSNIVNLAYVVQYRVADAFPFLYGLADPVDTLRQAAQAAVRETVGSKSIDEVLSTDRGEIQQEAQRILQTTLDGYLRETRFAGQSAFDIGRVVLQVVQPPAAVQEAFDDVVAAQQDLDRAISVARGDAKEIRERADAEAREKLEAATAYKDAKILEARGEAGRFSALFEEYARAPEVTRRRLYLETMEQVMPSIEKVVVEPDAVSLMPFFPLQGRTPAVGAPAPEEKP